MDEAVELVMNGSKIQNIQALLSLFISGLNSFFFYIIPFLLNSPILNDKFQINNISHTNNTLEEFCYNENSKDINKYIDINNYSSIYKLFCEENSFKIQILIFLYFLFKGIIFSYFKFI